MKYGTQEDTPDTGLAAEPQWASPPRQLELAPPGAAEFVICDHTIEFSFRDAKQYWGLEDFMNVTPTGVTNAANLSLFMVNVAYRLRTDHHPRDPDYQRFPENLYVIENRWFINTCFRKHNSYKINGICFLRYQKR